MKLQSLKNFSNNLLDEDLLNEAYSEGISFGDLKDYYHQNNQSLNKYSFYLKDGTEFKLSKEMLIFIASKLDTIPDSQNSDYLIAIDAKLSKYKITRDFAKTLKLSQPELKKLDSNLTGIGNGSIASGGSNFGDETEILFNFAVYNYILTQGDTQNFNNTCMDLIESITKSGANINDSKDIELSKKIKITINFNIVLKNKDILENFKGPKNKDKYDSTITQILHFITTNKGIWTDIVDQIRSKSFSDKTTITFNANGAADSKDDRSDLKIIIDDPATETRTESFSLKNNNKTLTKIVSNSLENIKTNLKYFGVILSSEEESLLSKNITELNKYKSQVKETSHSVRSKMENILDTKGYLIASKIFEIIISNFNKMSSKDRLINFILNTAFYFGKGVNEKVHDEMFTIIDIYKSKQSIIKEKNKYFDETKEVILEQEGKKLSLTKGNFSEQKKRINSIILLHNNTKFFGFRYSPRNLDTNPRFEIYIEVTNLEIFNDILKNIE